MFFRKQIHTVVLQIKKFKAKFKIITMETFYYKLFFSVILDLYLGVNKFVIIAFKVSFNVIYVWINFKINLN